jgi:hypothetical protein
MSETNKPMNVDIKELCFSKKEFFAKWGIEWESCIVKFIEKSPSFEGDIELAKKIGYLLADLSSVMGCLGD